LGDSDGSFSRSDPLDPHSALQTMTEPAFTLTLAPAYWLLAAFFGVVGALNFRQRRWVRGMFWLLLGALFITAPSLPTPITGALVIITAALAFAANSERLDDARTKSLEADAAEHSLKLGAKLLKPAIALPLLTVAMTLIVRAAAPELGVGLVLTDAPLIGLVIAVLLVLLIASWDLRFTPKRAAIQGAQVLDQIGWPVLLPMLLAILGAVYAKSGVGDALAANLFSVFPTDNRYVCVLLFGTAMALLTMLLGNAFAAFPVVLAAVGIPLVVKLHHGDPLAMSAIGMLCGYCGTLMTPLAANFNLVPVVLLDIADRNAVIKAQIPTALALLAGNLALLCALVFR
jgi:uncharacterized membrane protein